MPMYDYECDACHEVVELMHKMPTNIFEDNYCFPHKLEDGKYCGGICLRVYRKAPAAKFVGPGFYENDYKGKS